MLFSITDDTGAGAFPGTIFNVVTPVNSAFKLEVRLQEGHGYLLTPGVEGGLASDGVGGYDQFWLWDYSSNPATSAVLSGVFLPDGGGDIVSLGDGHGFRFDSVAFHSPCCPMPERRSCMKGQVRY